MNHTNRMIASAVTGLLVLGLSAAPAMAEGKAEMEKCYGVSKAGKNDCQTATSSCAGTSKTDGQKDAFIMVPAGTCEKIVGGSTQPMKS